MTTSKPVTWKCLTIGLLAALCFKPALGQQSAEDGQREQANQQATFSSGLAASGPSASGPSASNSSGAPQHDGNAMPDPASASSVDADGAALQAAIRQAIEDLQARRKAQQQALAAKASQTPNRHAPNWQGLNKQEQRWLQPLAAVWHELPSADRYAWLQLARQFPKLPQAAQDQAQERMKQWSTFTPQQRQAARENFRLAQKLNDSKLSEGQLQALWERYRELTPEQRAVLRAAGQTASTAARHAGAATPLAKEAARPLPPLDRHGKPTP
jgi:hypothetical protein